MISACSFLSTLVLLSELSGHLLTVAMPAAKDANDGAMEQDGLGMILGDEVAVEAAGALPPYRRSNSLKDEDQRPKIIIVSVSVISTLAFIQQSHDKMTFCTSRVFSFYTFLQDKCEGLTRALQFGGSIGKSH